MSADIKTDAIDWICQGHVIDTLRNVDARLADGEPLSAIAEDLCNWAWANNRADVNEADMAETLKGILEQYADKLGDE